MSEFEPLGKYITDISYGTSQASNPDGWGYPTLRIPNVIGDKPNLEDLSCVDAPPSDVERYRLHRGDLLLVRTNGNPNYIGRSILFDPPDERIWMYASYLIRVRLGDGIVPKFVDHYLKSGSGRQQLLKRVTTSAGNHNINSTSIRTIPIPRFQAGEQEVIARILDAADAAIERTRATVAAARRVKRGLVQALLSRGTGHTEFKPSEFGPIPAAWEVVRVRDLITQAQYGLSMPMADRGEYPILRMAAIQSGDVLLDDLKYVDLPQPIASDYLLRRGDVLFNRTNSLEHVGKVGVYRSDRPAVFASYLIRLKVNPERADNYYLGQLLASYAVQCRIRRYATPGVQQVNINATNLQRVLVAMPVGPTGLPEQRQIADILERQDDSIRRLNARVELLQRLKRGLMQVLLTGKVRVPVPLV